MTAVTPAAAAAAWPSDGIELLGACPLCGSPERRILHEDLQDLLFGSPRAQWSMHACNACGLGYLDPRPSEASIGLAYSSYFTHADIEDDPRQRTRGLQGLKNLVLRHYLASRHRPMAMLQHPLGLAVRIPPRLRRDLDAATRFLPRPGQGATLLDIGCGNGRFMAWARAAGWNCVGTEVDLVAARLARERGFEVHTESLDRLVAGKARFDAVTISHVIEHVHAPRKLLAAARALLRPGGFFWIETPNLLSHGHACFGRHWRGLEPPRHLQIFHPDLLKRLLREAGFGDVRVAPWQSDWRGIFAPSLGLARAAGDDKALARLAPLRRAGERVGRDDPDRRDFITLLAR